MDSIICNNGRKEKMVLCECQCENKTIKTMIKNYVLSGKSKSCRCLQKEKAHLANKKYNTYDLTGEYGIGYTSNTNEPFYFDLEDYDKIKDYIWFKYHTGYIQAYDSCLDTSIRLHRLLFNLKIGDKVQIDHINNKRKFDITIRRINY